MCVIVCLWGAVCDRMCIMCCGDKCLKGCVIVCSWGAVCSCESVCGCV